MLALATSEPLLSAEALRIDIDGVPVSDGLSFVASGERVLLLGAGRGLFEVLLGLRPFAAGALRMRGEPMAIAANEGRVAGALTEATLPPDWSPREYVTWSARLAGISPREARSYADDALAGMGLLALRDVRASRLPPLAHRATLTAAALATGAEVIVLSDPLSGLSDEHAAFYAAQLVTALEGRAWIVLAPRVPLGSPLALAADEAIVLSADAVLAQATPVALAAAERRFALCIEGPLAAIAPTLESRSVRVEARGGSLVIDLGEHMTTRELVTLCAAAGVAVVELVPLHRALS